MARKTSTFIGEGRDKGKQFLLTEMPATKAEDWAIRAMLALGAANVEIPDGALQLGMAALAEIGIKKLFSINPEQMRPLLAELMECVVMVPNPSKPEVTLQHPLYECQIEDVKTLLMLKWEVLKLHLDFLPADGLLGFLGKSAEAESRKSVTRMSPKSSASS